MSFRITWPTFSADFLALATAQLTTALNKGEKPANIVDDIVVKELHMGTKPPDLEILEIGELSEERFRGIFKLTYSGDGFVVLQAKVQVSSRQRILKLKDFQSTNNTNNRYQRQTRLTRPPKRSSSTQAVDSSLRTSHSLFPCSCELPMSSYGESAHLLLTRAEELPFHSRMTLWRESTCLRRLTTCPMSDAFYRVRLRVS